MTKAMKRQKSSPLFVAISDIHFNLNNLELSSAALKAAILEAERLSVPLIIAGDLHDTKAIIRGEIANRLISILATTKVKVYILVGNHDLLNEKGSEHGLNYLAPYATIIDESTRMPIGDRGVLFIPYQTDKKKFEIALKNLSDEGCIIVMHQGVMGAEMGDYVVDKSSIDPALLAPFTCISGHYHRHQTIGTLTYIGSPFSMSFGEANDGLKGFVIVNRDGSITRENLNLRKHIVIDERFDHPGILCSRNLRPGDLIWIKIRGPSSELAKITKDRFSKILGHSNFKLDKIPDEKDASNNNEEKNLTGEEILDRLIDRSNETPQEKKNLKKLWREALS